MHAIEGIRPERAVMAAGLLGGLALAVVLLRTYDPAMSVIYPPCPFEFLTGLYCPGCGTLRGLNLLLNGHLAAGFWSNPLMMLALPFIFYALAARLVAWLGARPYRPVPLPAWVNRAILIVVVVFWVLRNVPVHPFNMLAP